MSDTNDLMHYWLEAMKRLDSMDRCLDDHENRLKALESGDDIFIANDPHKQIADLKKELTEERETNADLENELSKARRLIAKLVEKLEMNQCKDWNELG